MRNESEATMFRTGDIVRYRADFVQRQFRTAKERAAKAAWTGVVDEVKQQGNLVAVVVRWNGTTMQLCYPQTLEVVG